MLLILTPHITERVKYVFDHIFRRHFGLEYRLTEDVSEYEGSPALGKIAYGTRPATAGLFFRAFPLLFETGIHASTVPTGGAGDVPVLFVHEQDSALHFDVFAAVFYLLSRYEEYVCTEKDAYGNFDSRQSILYRMHVLQEPLVERWLALLQKVLEERFPQLRFREQEYRYALSFDIDVAYEYRHKGFPRMVGSAAKKILRGDFTALRDLVLTQLGRREDAFDTYEYIFEQARDSRTYFFFNMGDYGKYDKNPSFRNPAFRQVVSRVHSRYEVGLHPSYASSMRPALLPEEKNRLEGITEHTIACSRQHYLKMQLPGTYEELIENGITEDFTMGYYFTTGFRAGTCNPFYFFNLVTNHATSLQVYPFVFMDRTLKDVMQLSPAKAKEHVSLLMDTVERNKGLFIPLWHNSSLGDTGEWTGWREVFEYMLQELRSRRFTNMKER
jgi:hypothetical protein